MVEILGRVNKAPLTIDGQEYPAETLLARRTLAGGAVLLAYRPGGWNRVDGFRVEDAAGNPMYPPFANLPPGSVVEKEAR